MNTTDIAFILLATSFTLHGEEDQEGNHQREQSSGFCKSKPQNCVREQLTSESWIASYSRDQAAKDSACIT